LKKAAQTRLVVMQISVAKCRPSNPRPFVEKCLPRPSTDRTEAGIILFEMGEIRRIVDILAEANATIDQMGTTAFVDALHRGDNAPTLVEIKEALELGQFAELYNQTNTPKLIYALANPPGSGRADFTVWDDTQNWSRDFEVTSLWEREDNFPQYTDEDEPDATHVELSLPRRPLDELLRELTKKLKGNCTNTRGGRITQLTGSPFTPISARRLTKCLPTIRPRLSPKHSRRSRRAATLSGCGYGIRTSNSPIQPRIRDNS
jgi:hypothetical protein